MIKIPTQKDMNLVLAKDGDIQINLRIDIYDSYFVKQGELQGYATSLTYSISSESDIRNTCNLNVYVADKSLVANSFQVFAPDNLLKVYVGLLDDLTQGYVWYLVGSYVHGGIAYSYNETAQEVSLSLLDLMSTLTDSRGGQVGASDSLIPAESNARNALISIISRFSLFKRYSIPTMPDTIPYDLSFTSEVYPVDMLHEIINLFPTYQMYYSPEGIFTVNEIPTGIGDPLFVDETFMDEIIISESRNNSYGSIRNTTEIFGASLNADHTASECTTIKAGQYILSLPIEFSVIEANSTYNFVPDRNSVAGQTLKLQSLAEYPIYTRTGAGVESPLAAGAMKANVPYVVKFVSNKFFLEGESDIHVMVREVSVMPTSAKIEADRLENNCRDIQYVVNPDSPFAYDRIGEFRQVLSDGEYASIRTTVGALERASYENWKKTRWQDSVTLECAYVPWMQTNVKIAYTSPLTGVVSQYLVQNIDADPVNWTMTLKLIQFYPYYPWLA